MSTQKLLKMYVLVRKDLAETYRNVQGTHAVAAYSLSAHRELYEQWGNETLIHLGVTNEWALMSWADKLKRNKKTFVEFHEPDLHDQLTAIACVDKGEIFKRLPLA